MSRTVELIHFFGFSMVGWVGMAKNHLGPFRQDCKQYSGPFRQDCKLKSLLQKGRDLQSIVTMGMFAKVDFGNALEYFISGGSFQSAGASNRILVEDGSLVSS
ncbi:hypothetical protein ACA910_000659 [Epithemia clementina (nom. ined.)]